MTHEEIEKLAAEKLKRLDNVEVKTPELKEIARLVNREKSRIAKRQNVQFALFTAFSFFTVSAFMLCLFSNAALYAALQAAAPLVFLILFIRKPEVRRGG